MNEKLLNCPTCNKQPDHDKMKHAAHYIFCVNCDHKPIKRAVYGWAVRDWNKFVNDYINGEKQTKKRG